MPKRKNRPNRGRMRQNRARTAQKSGTRTAPATPKDNESNGASQMNKGSEAEKPRLEWVTVEHRDADGNRMFSQEVIASTYLRRYGEVPHGTEIKVLVLVGYKPKDLMLVERKIYEIHRLLVHGWRRSGQIALEMDGWRQHEADWFKAMRGCRLEIPDTSLPGAQSQKSDYIISETAFHRKMVILVGENGSKTELQMYEGTLDITETWKSAWRRQAAEILNMGFKYFLLPLFTALVAGLIVWWIELPPDSDDNDLATRKSSSKHGVQEGVDDSETKPSDKSGNFLPPSVPSRETGIERQDSTGSSPNDKFSTEGSSDDGEEGKSKSHMNAGNPRVERHAPTQLGSADPKQGHVYEWESADN